MGRKGGQKPADIDITDPELMDWINEMRNSQPSATQYEEKQKKYHSKPEVIKRKREASRIRYTTPTRRAL